MLTYVVLPVPPLGVLGVLGALVAGVSLVAGAALGALVLLSVLVVLVLVLVVLLAPTFELLAPEYKSPYQPLPLRMKFPWVIWREASSFPHLMHSLLGSSEMRWTRSKSCPQAAHR